MRFSLFFMSFIHILFLFLDDHFLKTCDKMGFLSGWTSSRKVFTFVRVYNFSKLQRLISGHRELFRAELHSVHFPLD